MLPPPGSGSDEEIDVADDGVRGVDEEVPPGEGVAVLGAVEDDPVEHGDEEGTRGPHVGQQPAQAV